MTTKETGQNHASRESELKESEGPGLSRVDARRNLVKLEGEYLDVMDKLTQLKKGTVMESYVGEKQVLEGRRKELYE
jgi:hypothetical protein